MNMFERTLALVSDHFIRHYTVNNIFCKLMQKRKNGAVHSKRHELSPTSLHVTRAQCNR